MEAGLADAASCDRRAVADGTTVATVCATTVACGATEGTFDVTVAGLTVTGFTVAGFAVAGFTVTVLTGGFGATGVVAAGNVAGRRKSTTTQSTGQPQDG